MASPVKSSDMPSMAFNPDLLTLSHEPDAAQLDNIKAQLDLLLLVLEALTGLGSEEMLTMPSVLRRYTPPTCTLEVMATESPLSRWTDRTVVNRLRFRLQFDDPRLPPEDQITLEGDRSALEVLSDVVDDYVQAQLVEPPSLPRLGAIARNEEGAIALQAPLQDLADRHDSSNFGIALHPNGSLSHRLHLGALAPDASHTVIQLSTLQLFDLATALDDCAGDVVAMATTQPSAWFKPSSGWLRAAAVMVLALGTTLSIVKFVDPTIQTASSPPDSVASSEDQQFGGITVLPKTAESELGAPQVDPDTLEPIPPPPTPEQSPSARTPRVTVPSQAPIPPITAETRPPVAASPVPSTDLPPALVLPSPSVESAPRASQNSDEPAIASRASLNDAPQAEQFSGASERLENRSMPDTADAGSESVFDVIPQVAEVRAYFEQRWQPPTGLNSDLQYSIVLNSNGSIQRVEPLGQAAATYLDRTSMPLAGEPFVSATATESSPRIRLVLRPDGGVQTFLESR